MRVVALLSLALVAVGHAQIDRGAPLPRKPAFGAQMAPLTADEATKIGQPGGAKIVRVMPGLTAEKIGVKDGDIILSSGSTPIGAPAQLSAFMRDQVSGKEATWKVSRGGKTLELKGVFVERPRQQEEGLEVVYDQVLSQGKRIRIIATHPKGPGPYPTLFLIGGIGAYSVDSNFSAMPYGNVVGPVAQKYATVRIDKPGMGDSEGPAYADLTFDAELDAYLQALRLAKTYSFVNKDKIAIFGHSMGGCFGPLVTAQEKVAGICAVGTLSKTWNEYMLENTRRQALLGGAKPADVDQDMRELTSVIHYLFNEGLSVAEAKAKRPDLAAAFDGQSPDGKTLSGVGIPFWQQLAKKNMMAAWEKSETQILMAYGENDFLTCEPDHTFVVETVNKLRPGTAEYQRIPQSDHGFTQTTSQLDSLQKWGKPGNAFNPVFNDILGKWLEKIFAK